MLVVLQITLEGPKGKPGVNLKFVSDYSYQVIVIVIVIVI